jgi:hypothetical protein
MLDHKVLRTLPKRTHTKESSKKKIKDVDKSLIKYGMKPLFTDGIHKNAVC